MADVLAVQKNAAAIATNQSYNHVKAGCFASAIWAQQANDLSTFNRYINFVYDL